MNNFKSCVPCVCTSSGRKQVFDEHDIGTQCGATATNTATETVGNFDAINIQQNQQTSLQNLQNQQKQQNQQNSQKLIRQLEVVPSPAEVCQNDPDGLPSSSLCAQQGAQMEKTSISEHSHP